MGRKSVDIDTKKKIITLNEVGFSKTKIAQHCHVSRNCVLQTIRKYEKQRTVAIQPGAGRPSKLSEKQKRSIKLEQLRDDTMSLSDLVRYVKTTFDVIISRSTISRILNKFGLVSFILPKKPSVNSRQRKTRTKWCLEHLEWTIVDWKKVIFSDECRFELINRKNKIYIRRYRHDKTRKQRSQPRTHRGGGLSVSGWMTYYGFSELLFYDGTIDSTAYIEIVRKQFPSALARFPTGEKQNVMLQQDNARPHVSRKTKNFFEKQGIRTLPWPPSSPDINIVENVWSIIDRKLLKYTIYDIDQLKNAVIEVWNEIPMKTIENLYLSIRGRLKRIVCNRGYP